MNKATMFFRIYSCIKIVKGYKSGALYDLQRKEYIEIPLDLCNLLISQNQNVLSINELENTFNPLDIDQFRVFIAWLNENEYIYFFNDKTEAELFPEISSEWNNTNLFINAIIDIDHNSKYNIHKAICDLQKINCHSIQFRIFTDFEIEKLIQILKFTIDKSFQNIELILPFQEKIDKLLLKNIAVDFPNVVSITFYDSPKNSFFVIEQLSIFFNTRKIVSEKDCGKINKSIFACDLVYFNEMHQCNICLNGKVAIDKNGQIKNCPSLPDNFGNIDIVDIENVFNNEEFKLPWYITKDKIEVCKDCEYRYMCSDCRAYVKNLKNIFSQPSKCKYNPYISRWEGEEGYIPIEEVGEYVNGSFIINKCKIDELNSIVF